MHSLFVEAERRNMRPEALQRRCQRLAEPLAFKSNGRWMFMDENDEEGGDAPPVAEGEAPMTEEKSRRVYSHWKALKMEAEAKATIRSCEARAAGLVQRSDLEREFTRLLARLRERIQAVPWRLKQQVGGDATSQVMERLNVLLREALQETMEEGLKR